MATVTFIKKEKLLEYLDVELRKALKSHDVLSMHSYAWSNEDTPSNDYIGLAKWEMESPQWTIKIKNAALSPEERARLLAVEIAGEDLWGLMEMSRLAIGQAILYSNLATKSPIEFHHPFWIHRLNAMTMLSMASERLRDVFLLGCFKQTAKEYKRGKADDAKHFDHPFCNAGALSCAQQFQQELVALADLARKIFEEGINKRNYLVHEVASRLGKLAQTTAGNDFDLFDKDRKLTYKEAKKTWDEASKLHHIEINAAVQSLVRWYKRLIAATSIVCDFEHTTRG